MHHCVSAAEFGPQFQARLGRPTMVGNGRWRGRAVRRMNPPRASPLTGPAQAPAMNIYGPCAQLRAIKRSLPVFPSPL